MCMCVHGLYVMVCKMYVATSERQLQSQNHRCYHWLINSSIRHEAVKMKHIAHRWWWNRLLTSKRLVEVNSCRVNLFRPDVSANDRLQVERDWTLKLVQSIFSHGWTLMFEGVLRDVIHLHHFEGFARDKFKEMRSNQRLRSVVPVIG